MKTALALLAAALVTPAIASAQQTSPAARAAQPGKEIAVRAGHLFDGQSQEVGEALEDLLGDFSCRTP